MTSSSSNPAFAEALRYLGRALTALEPYAQDLLVIGGMVPFLWRHSVEFGTDTLPHVGTTEVDLSVAPRLPIKDVGIRERLEGADFVVFERPGYRDHPGAICFQDRAVGSSRRAPNYIEFLAPLRGRGGKAWVEVQPGLRAEALRYLDLLAFEPVEIMLDGAPELTLSTAVHVRVPQPVTYVAQKILARSSGRLSRAEKAAKDLAYIFHAARISRQRWDSQRDILNRAAREGDDWKRWIERARRELEVLYETTTASGPVEAGRIYRDLMGKDAPRDDEIQRVVARFAAATFGALVE